MKLFFQDIKTILIGGGPLVWVFMLMMGTALHPQNVYLVTVFCGMAWFLLVFGRKVKWDGITTGLFMFSIFYGIILFLNDKITSGMETVNYVIAPTAYYLFGKYLVSNFKIPNILFAFLVISFALYSLILYMSILTDISANGFGNIMRDVVASGHEKASAATLLGVYASLGLAGVVVFLKAKEVKDYKWWILVAMLALSMTSVMHLINRTGIVVVAAVLIFCLLLYSRGKVFKFFFPTALIILVLYALVNTGVLNEDIFLSYEARESGQGIESAGGRTWRWIMAFEYMVVYPFGWSDVSGFYVHNGWLDIARMTGIIPCLLYTITNIKVLRKTWTLVKGHLDNFFVIYLVGLNIVFFLTFFVEPIIQGVPGYFYLYSMLWGVEIEMLKRGTLNKIEQ